MTVLRLKPLDRLIAFDDGAFTPRKKSTALLAGVVSRFDGRVEGIVSSRIHVDGLDSTKKIVSLVNDTRFSPQIKLVFLQGLTFAGFNVADINRIALETGRPVIAVMQRKPNYAKISSALKRLPSSGKRLALIGAAGKPSRAGNLFIQCAGISAEDACTAIKRTSQHSSLPDALRLAHFIASGVSLGVSTRP